MKPYSATIANSTIHLEHLQEAKLKLVNASPASLRAMLDAADAKKEGSLRAKLGMKAKIPLNIHALSDLHLEAKYISKQGKPFQPTMPQNPWASAKAFVALRDLQSDGSPQGRANSTGDKKKSVRFELPSLPQAAALETSETL